MRICYLSSRFPYPVEKGDKLRAYHHIRHLSGMHEVHLLALSHEKVGPEQIEELKKFCASVSVFRLKPSRIPVNLIRSALKGLPFQVGYFQDPAVKKELQKTLIAADPDLLISQLIRTTEYARGLPCFKVLDYMDVFSIGAAQRSRSGNWLLRPIYALEHHLVKNYERQIYADFNRHMIISRQDRDRLPLPYSKSVRVVPNGVNLEYFQPMKTEPRYDVVFVGNMGYLPNIEAAQYLVRRIMPNVWNQYPEARVCLAGARPSEKVRRLQSERVEVTGWVEDIRP